MVNLGMEIEHGGGGEQGETAVGWYEAAAKGGSEKGRYNLARCYHAGGSHAKAVQILGPSVWDLGCESGGRPSRSERVAQRA